MRRRTVPTALVTLSLAFCGVIAVGSPAEAASVSISRTAVISGESVKIGGAFNQKVVRPTQLQKKVGTSWITFQKGKTTTKGAFGFTFKPTGTLGKTYSYRVRAPQATVAGTTYATVASAARTVTLVKQTATLTAPTSATARTPFTATATLRPIRTGRISILQHQVNGAWVELKRGAQNSLGKTSFSVTFANTGTKTLRVVAATSAGAPPIGSASRLVTVVRPELERASVSAAGVQGDDTSRFPSLSSDGRYVAFQSAATNLVTGDSNGVSDIFVRDNETAIVERVSVSTAGVAGDAESSIPRISANGRYVVFTSSARNLHGATDPNGSADVFLHDRTLGTTEKISVGHNGTASGQSFAASVSSDGNLVSFTSFANNIVPGDTNNKVDVFVRNRATGTSTMVSTTSDGSLADGSSGDSRISADGNWVAFQTLATNLLPGDANATSDIYLRNLALGTVTRVSSALDGKAGDDTTFYPQINADGSRVSFSSRADDLVLGDQVPGDDIFVWTRATGGIELVSLNDEGSQLYSDGFQTGISDDGRYVTFSSPVGGFDPTDTNGKYDVFLRDTQLQTTRRVSQANGVGGGDVDSPLNTLSGDGTTVAFSSDATNLVPGDTNTATDVFVRKVG